MPRTRFVRIKSPLFVLNLLIPLLLIPFFSLAQLKTISGTVADSSGAPLSDISVIVQKTNVGTKTDVNGRFTISAAPGATIVFSSLNHDPFTLTVDDRADYRVVLLQKASNLADVVVVGYGRQKRANLVGAVSTVVVDEKVTSRALPNISAGLSGMVPGLSAVQNSGMAGRNGATLLIRGLGTVNNSNPLIVVDGMPDVDINRVNVNDIETVTVLKDATSASVYGSRAANGVILITTKSGKGAKKTSLNFNSNMALEVPRKGFQFMADYPRALTLHQRRAAVNTAPANQQFKNGTIDQWMALGMIDPLRYPNTDWWDVILQNGSFTQYNLSASGGNDKSNFFASVGVKDELGLQINNTYTQYNARFNFDYKLRSNMNTGFRFNGNWSKFVYALEEGFTDPDASNTAGFDMQYAIAGITPYDPVSGKFGGVMAYGEDPQAYNPYTLYVNSLNRVNRQEANATAYIDWTPIKGLTATLDYNMIYYNQFGYTANMPNTAFNFQTNANGSRVYVGANAGVSNNTATGYKTLMNAKLNYNFKLGTNHDFSVLGVYSEEYWYDRNQGSSRNDRLHPTLTEINAALTDIQSTSGSSSTEGLRSYIGRFNYTAFGKYLLEANFRIDGSSKFLPGHQYGVFPSAALGWRFTEEKFMLFADRVLSSGKLRVSYGSLGNNSNIGRFQQQPTLGTNNYVMGGSVVRGFVLGKLINPNLSWETSKMFNLGLELAFLNNRLTAEVDYYDRLTEGMIQGTQQSIILNGTYNAPTANIGNLRNRGVEGTLTWKDRFGKLNYSLSLNAGYNRGNLESWNEFLNKGSVFVNMPYNFTYTYVDRGIAQTWQDVYNATPQGAQPGDILREDLNGDGRITGEDIKALPNSSRDRPNTTAGLNGFVNYGSFDLAFFFNASAGRKTWWLNAFNNPNFGAQRYASTWDHWNETWSVENRDGTWPRLGGSGNNTAQTTLWLENMNYIRMKNLQIGYNLPKRWLSKISANNLRIAGSAENLFTITNYRGLDPEKGGNNNNLYPINKAYSIVVQLGF